MVNIKRRLSLAAACLAALMALAACQGGGSSSAAITAPASTASASSGDTTSATSSAAPASSELKPYEIQWYIEGGGQPPETDRIMAAANEKLKSINATLKFNLITWADWPTKINAMLASGDYYDILFTANWNQFSAQVNQNVFLNLDDLYAQYGQNIIADCGQAMLDRVKVGGHWYSVPVNKDNFTGYGFVFNQKLLDKYGWKTDDLKTIEDITPWLEKIKASEPGILPFATGTGNNFINNVDTGDITGDGNVPLGMYDDNRSKQLTFVYDSKWVQYQLGVIRKWYQAGYIDPSSSLSTSTANADAMTNGTVFCAEEPLKPGKAGEMSNAKITWTQWLISDYFAHAPFGAMQSISKNCKDPARCMMFLNMLYGDESKKPDSLLNLLTFGQKDKDYTLDASGHVQLVANPGWNFNNPWMLGNQLNQMLLTTQPPTEYQEIAAVNQSCHPTYFDSFLLNPTPIQTQMAAVSAAVKPLVEPLNVGAVDVMPQIEKIRAAAKAAGLDQIQAEIQKQLDAAINNNAQPYTQPFNKGGQYN